MVGEGVLFECLENAAVTEILLISRRPYPIQDKKLRELILPDFSTLADHTALLQGYDACFYCAGISSVGKTEEEFYNATYQVVVPFATTLASINPQMVFDYVSGARTDSSEKGKQMWARVKGKTENSLLRLPFRHVFCFRPAIMKGFPGQKNVKTIYKLAAPLVALFYPQKTLTLQQVGRAMINTVRTGYPKQILEVDDIDELAK